MREDGLSDQIIERGNICENLTGTNACEGTFLFNDRISDDNVHTNLCEESTLAIACGGELPAFSSSSTLLSGVGANRSSEESNKLAQVRISSVVCRTSASLLRPYLGATRRLAISSNASSEAEAACSITHQTIRTSTACPHGLLRHPL